MEGTAEGMLADIIVPPCFIALFKSTDGYSGVSPSNDERLSRDNSMTPSSAGSGGSCCEH